MLQGLEARYVPKGGGLAGGEGGSSIGITKETMGRFGRGQQRYGEEEGGGADGDVDEEEDDDDVSVMEGEIHVEERERDHTRYDLNIDHTEHL